MKNVSLLAATCQNFPGVSKDLVYGWILCGEIKVNDETCKDPKARIKPESRITRIPRSFVSRGGDKLFPVLTQLIHEYPALDPQGKWVLDAGSSTGGFVDVLLSLGAAGVYAVDVGTNQLDYRLRVDSRVRVKENTNIQDICGDDLEPRPVYCLADLSFRSVVGVLPNLLEIGSLGLALVLLKPQFETDFHPSNIEFRGVVSNEIGNEIVHRVLTEIEKRNMRVLAIRPASIPGTKGNQEYFVLLTGTQV